MDYLALKVAGKDIQPSADIPSGGLDTLSQGISVAMSLMIIAAIIAALFFLVLGGMQWSTSGGDKGRITAARAKITYALIGMIVAITAFMIVNIFGGFFGVSFFGK